MLTIFKATTFTTLSTAAVTMLSFCVWDLANAQPSLSRGGGGSGFIDAQNFGATCDVVAMANDGSIEAGETRFRSGLHLFAEKDVGKYIVIAGAGALNFPLSAQIVSVAGATATLNTAAITTVSRAIKWYYGTDDSAAINNALLHATKGESVGLPAAKCGVASSIELPVSENSFNGCPAIIGVAKNSTEIFALRKMQQVIYRSSKWSHGGGLSELTVDAFKLASYGVYTEGPNQFFFRVDVRNALISEWRQGNGTAGGGGHDYAFVWGYTENSIFSPSQRSMYNFWAAPGASDSRISASVFYNASASNIFDQTYGMNQYISPHCYGFPVPEYLATYCIHLTGKAIVQDAELDGASDAGIYVGDYALVNGAIAQFGGVVPTAVGVKIKSGARFVIVTGVSAPELLPSQVIQQVGKADPSTCVRGNSNASYSTNC